MKRELEIKKLADFCVSCVTKPCQLGCPLNNDITSFIKNVKNDNYSFGAPVSPMHEKVNLTDTISNSTNYIIDTYIYIDIY